MERARGSARDEQGGAESRWQGLSVSDGIALGKALRIHSGARYVYRATLEDEADVAREMRRLRAAFRLARRQLLAIKRRAELELGADHAYIFDAHILMLEDRRLLDEALQRIRRERVNAEWAVKVVADRLLAIYAEIKDDYLRERGSDIEDVVRRILVALSGEPPQNLRLTEDSIIVAEELLPSTAAELDFAQVRAIASDAGGWTSHTAIIARGLGIPAVVGLRDLFRHARTGDPLIIDATSGEAVLHPSAETEALYREKAQARAAERGSSAPLPPITEAARLKPLLTADGEEIILRANVELPAEYGGVRRYGARGIGLYRSEFLWSQRGVMPTEEEQYQAYTEIAELTGADGATVRLFDLGGEKMSLPGIESERNPALGLRAIRLGLRHEELIRTQARAILRAATRGRLSIVLPMISDAQEARQAKRIIDEERARLVAEGVEAGEVKVGAMIEVPSAVLTADRLAREVDFFSLGTNDLVQYLLAVDRSNDQVAGWFRSLHPAVLLSIQRTLDAARAAEIPVTICGEMGATPAYAVILVGLGAREFSMTASSIPRLRRALAGIEVARARQIAEECLSGESADEVEEIVRAQLGSAWPQLFPPETLPPPKQ